MIILNSIQGVL